MLEEPGHQQPPPHLQHDHDAASTATPASEDSPAVPPTLTDVDISHVEGGKPVPVETTEVIVEEMEEDMDTSSDMEVDRIQPKEEEEQHQHPGSSMNVDASQTPSAADAMDNLELSPKQPSPTPNGLLSPAIMDEGNDEDEDSRPAKRARSSYEDPPLAIGTVRHNHFHSRALVTVLT